MSILKLNGLHLSRLIIAGANELTANKQLVDAMNVFPVPDGDTGTNMSLTVLAAARESEKSSSLRVDEVSKLAAGGALRGARGNSGVITSQLFRGFSKGLEGLEEATVTDLALALEGGVQTAYKAVMKPKEGTILTVARACADAAARLSLETDDIEVFLKGIIEYGHEVLAKTPDMLPVLKQAGVVDAGGRGFLYVLEGAYNHLNYEGPISVVQQTKSETVNYAVLASVENVDITFGYCTEFFINVHEADDATVQILKSYLGTIGDSIVCVNDEEVIKIHVHTDHPGLALEKALSIGSLSGLKIENMREQHTNYIDFTAKAALVDQADMKMQVQEKKAELPPKPIGFVSISAGKGLCDIFKNLGVDVIIEGGQTMNPSTEDILNAIGQINAENIIILPNNKNIILAAEQAVALCENKKLFVVPTRSIPQGISAMFCNAEGLGAEEMTEAMKDAIQAVSTVSVTYAVRDTCFGDKEIFEGDILGMLNDEISVVAKDVATGTKEVLKQTITDDNEMVSIYYGTDVDEKSANEIADFIKENYPDCEVEIQKGDQPLYFYIISVE
ncbi:DAK2 domain protein [Anaerotignum neopropionicum]|uniref:DAK2 domain protein n=1 Tax=Anaerotignum neopropionicum TaxID=36847 RepID=A0A136WGA1_9FIRM|nr:DAK2 domain-containing protein [Anaerotignum neopropionicum]KXL53470.1 DAK2 domain protein [Anaerotignum neopropionicum]